MVFTVTRDGATFVCKRLSARIVREPEAVAAFERERQVLEALVGSGAPLLVDAGDDESGPFLVMGHVELPRLDAGAAEVVCAPAFHALARVHDTRDAKGPLEIVHGDISPSNVLANAHAACLVDFGFAHFRDAPTVKASSFIGTLRYAAPEQARGEAFGQPADVFSLALALTHAVTGIAPRAAESEAAMMLLAGEGDLVGHLERVSPLISAPIRDRLVACLASDPRARPSARDVFP